MPYELHKNGSETCVHRQGSSSPVPGGCHPSRAQAIKHMRALYAAESSAADSNLIVMNPGRVLPIKVAESAASLPAFSLELQEVEGTGTEMHGVEVPPDGTEVELQAEEERGPAWHGPLAVEGVPTADKRLLIPGEISERALPVPLNVQIQTGDGHEDSFNAGRIEDIQHVPFAELDPEIVAEFGLEDLPENSIVIMGRGTFDTSEYADEAQRMLANGAGVSVDVSRERVAMFDPETLEEIDGEMGLEDLLFGDHLQGFGGKIGGATVVTIPAFEVASIKVVEDQVLVASAYGLRWNRPFALIASAGPVKPPREWFENPKFKELTPWTVTKDGRCFGHLADWDGCHIGFQGVCVPPFRSLNDFGYFNTQEIETAEGDLVAVGKVMFSRSGAGHAPTDPSLTYRDVQRYYDDATRVGAFVHAGSDRYGTWIAGALRSDLTDLEVQHMRTHGPSGDWRPIHPNDLSSELIASLAVPVQGFPIKRQALVASADGQITAIITAPLSLEGEPGMHRRQRKRVLLRERLREVFGMAERTRAEMRRQAIEELEASETWLDDYAETLGEFAPTAEQRREWARQGVALPDGSYPITTCSGEGTSAENAIRSQGRGQTPASQARVVAHIRKRVRALGCSGGMFDDYR